MAQDPNEPKDNGNVGLPRMGPGMVKLPPLGAKTKKRRRPRKIKDVRDIAKPPALSENTNDVIEDQNADAEEDTPFGAKGAKDKEDTKPTGEDDDDIRKRAQKRFTRAISYEAENRKAELEDEKFENGDQWDPDVAKERQTDGRPMISIPRVAAFVNQIANDQRQNRPAINVSPMGDKGDPEAAKIYRGMIRAIERECAADIAYDTGFHHAVAMGEGFFRIVTQWEEGKSFDQVIAVKRIRNRFTVYIDPGAQDPTGADARWGLVTELIPRDQFETDYPDADPMPFNMQGMSEGYKDWIAQNEVRIAEYFELTEESKTLVELDNGWTGYRDELSDDVKQRIESKRILVKRQREVKVPRWDWYKLTAVEILERNRWLGFRLPVIRIVGNEIDIEGKVSYSGVIRGAKGAQRVYNSAVTAQVEITGLQPKAPYIMSEGQMEGHEDEWKEANRKNYSVLQYKVDSVGGHPVPPPQRAQPPAPSAGWEVLRQQAAQDMMATTGVRFDPTNSETRVDDSGRAIRELRRSSDLGSFHYVDNLSRALKNAGEQYIDLIPKIYDEKRTVMMLREDDTEERIIIDPDAHAAFSKTKDAKGKVIKILNPTKGKYAVTVTVGPSYATKRIEASESMMQFAKLLPQTAALFADLIAKEQDWHLSDVIAARIAATMPPQVLMAGLEDMPPQAQAVIQALDTQLKQTGTQLQSALAALKDKDKDRQVALLKIEHDFESKILAVIQKAEAAFQTHIGDHVRQLSDGVKNLHAEMTKSKGEPKAV